jgi:hypothetical protein
MLILIIIIFGKLLSLFSNQHPNISTQHFHLAFFYFCVSALPQCFSIPVSFLSLTLASVRLFYSQRLGRFLDINPSFKLIVFVFPLIMFQIIGSVASLVLSAAYLREVVIMVILLHVFTQFIVLKFFLLIGKPITDHQTNVFWTAVFTAWMSPCTVWENNLITKSYFLLVSSSTSILIHSLSLISICIYISLDELSLHLAPIFHCQNSTQVDMKNVILTNKTFINICHSGDLCFPIQKICALSENSTDLFFTIVLPIGFSLLVVSFLASLCLQLLGNYNNMYKWSKRICCPIIHFAMLQDLLRNPQETEEFTARLNKLLDLSFAKDPTIFQQKDLERGDTLLLAALESDLFEIVKKIGEMVKNMKQKMRCNF